MLGIIPSVFVGHDSLPEEMTGAELRWTNPTHILTEESASEFPDRHVACILSIGSEHLKVLTLHESLESPFLNIVADCKFAANEISKRFEDVPEVYWRLDVEQGFENMEEGSDFLHNCPS
jgi:hypothetical protein